MSVKYKYNDKDNSKEEWSVNLQLTCHRHHDNNISLTLGYLALLRGNQASLHQHCYRNVPAGRATIPGVTRALTTKVVKIMDISAAFFYHRNCIVYGTITFHWNRKKKINNCGSFKDGFMLTGISLCLRLNLCSSRQSQELDHSLCLPCRCNLHPESWHQLPCSVQQKHRLCLCIWFMHKHQYPTVVL